MPDAQKAAKQHLMNLPGEFMKSVKYRYLTAMPTIWISCASSPLTRHRIPTTRQAGPAGTYSRRRLLAARNERLQQRYRAGYAERAGHDWGIRNFL